MLLIIKLKIIYIITSETTEQIKTEQTIKNDGWAEKREKARVRVEFRAWPRVEVRGKCQKDKLKDSPHDRTYVMECFVGFGHVSGRGMPLLFAHSPSPPSSLPAFSFRAHFYSFLLCKYLTWNYMNISSSFPMGCISKTDDSQRRKFLGKYAYVCTHLGVQ